MVQVASTATLPMNFSGQPAQSIPRTHHAKQLLHDRIKKRTIVSSFSPPYSQQKPVGPTYVPARRLRER
jgi:hypothetical protein